MRQQLFKFTRIITMLACIGFIASLYGSTVYPTAAQTIVSSVINATAYSPNGAMIAVVGGTKDSAGTVNPVLKIFDAGTQMLLLDLGSELAPQQNLGTLAWSPDSTRLATGGSEAKVYIWDITAPSVQKKRLLAELTGHELEVMQVAWSSDGNTLASLGAIDFRPLRLWDVRTLPYRLSAVEAGDSLAISWSKNPAQNRLYWVGSSRLGSFNVEQDGTITTDSGIIHRNRELSWPLTIAINTDNTQVAITVVTYNFDLPDTYSIEIYNMQTWSLLRTISLPAYSATIAWSKNNNWLAVYLVDNTIRVYDTMTGTLVATHPTGTDTPAWEISWNPLSGQFSELAHGGKDGNLRVVDVTADPPLNRVGNRIWLDLNGNGIQDINERGIWNVQVNLLRNNFTIAATQKTNTDGYYTFSDVPAGDYYIEIIPPADTYTIAPVDRGADDTLDSDFDWRDNFGTPDPTDRVLRSMRFTASAGMQRDDVDAGFMPR